MDAGNSPTSNGNKQCNYQQSPGYWCYKAMQGRYDCIHSHGMTYLDVWRSGTFPEKQQVSALPIANTDHRTTERSTSDSLGDVSWIQKAALQLYRRNVPSSTRLGTSYHVTQFYQAFPHVSTASDKRWGEKAWV